jgi:dipeptidyl aminopeptidase/acylaminoacyl peptidase
MNKIASVATAAALCAVVFLAPESALAQAPAPAKAGDQADDKAKAARAKRIAQQFEAQARVLTVFDRQGKVVTTVGERAIYDRPVFSPDRTRLAVVKGDLESETNDLWVLDVATGKSTRITANQTREGAQWPVWSPDGSQVAYGALRGGYFGLYRKASNGAGTEELLYQHPGGPMDLAADRGVMAVEVSTAPRLTFGKPTLLFRLSEAIPVPAGVASVSRDGQQLVIALPQAPTLQQITVFDRLGHA